MPDHEQDSQLAVVLAELTSKIQTLIDRHEELADNVSKIKEAVYNPDSGLYARLKELDMRLLALESWKRSNAKALWILMTVGAGLLTTTVWQTLF